MPLSKGARTVPNQAQRAVLDLLSDGASHSLDGVPPATVQALRRREWIQPVNGRPWSFRITNAGQHARAH